MRVLIAPDAFKGSLSTVQAAEAVASGIREAIPDADIDLLPLADGGEGTLDVLISCVSDDPGRVTPEEHIVYIEDGTASALIESATVSAAIGAFVSTSSSCSNAWTMKSLPAA